MYKIRIKQTVHYRLISSQVWEYSSLLICLFSQMMKLNYLIRKVCRDWTDLQPQKTLIYKWQQPCTIYISVIIVSKENKQICMLLLKIFTIAMTCRSVAHKMTGLFALQVSHISLTVEISSLTGMTSIMQILNSIFFPGLVDNSQHVWALVSLWRKH